MYKQEVWVLDLDAAWLFWLVIASEAKRWGGHLDFWISLSKDLIEGCEAETQGAAFSGGYAFGHKARLMVQEVEDAILRREGTVWKNSGQVEVYFTRSWGTGSVFSSLTE